MTNEQIMWQAVVFRAVVDALLPLDKSNDQERYERQNARRWMKGNSRDFFAVCTLAGIDPLFLRHRFASGALRLEDLATNRQVRHAAE